MSAKTFVIVDTNTQLPVGLFTCDDNPDVAAQFGGVGQVLVDDPNLVEQIKAATTTKPVDPFEQQL